MSTFSSRSLRPMTLKWLLGLVIFDALIVLLFVTPELIENMPLTGIALLRASAVAVLPVCILLVTGMLSAEAKASLIYWRVSNPNPGSEAFSHHGPRDTRIDLSALRKNVGTFPSEPREQNAKWYKLYQRVAGEPSVIEAHKFFLVYREMAVISLLLMVLVAPLLYWIGTHWRGAVAVAGFFFAQYLITVLSARHSGIRFVQNVLALHATKKWPAT